MDQVFVLTLQDSGPILLDSGLSNYHHHQPLSPLQDIGLLMPLSTLAILIVLTSHLQKIVTPPTQRSHSTLAKLWSPIKKKFYLEIIIFLR